MQYSTPPATTLVTIGTSSPTRLSPALSTACPLRSACGILLRSAPYALWIFSAGARRRRTSEMSRGQGVWRDGLTDSPGISGRRVSRNETRGGPEKLLPGPSERKKDLMNDGWDGERRGKRGKARDGNEVSFNLPDCLPHLAARQHSREHRSPSQYRQHDLDDPCGGSSLVLEISDDLLLLCDDQSQVRGGRVSLSSRSVETPLSIQAEGLTLVVEDRTLSDRGRR